jgi:hypothetical protein
VMRQIGGAVSGSDSDEETKRARRLPAVPVSASGDTRHFKLTPVTVCPSISAGPTTA